MAITVKVIQDSLRLPENTDNELIQRYIDTSEEYVQNAVDTDVSLETYRKTDLFNTAVALMTEYLYQSRSEVSDSPSKPPLEVAALIVQLSGKTFDDSVK